MGPALMFASQIMISLTFAPPAVLAVKRSYATSATMVPEVLWDQSQVVYRSEFTTRQYGSKRGTEHAAHRHALDGTQFLVEPGVKLDVGEALDAVAAAPVPGGLPSNRVAI